MSEPTYQNSIDIAVLKSEFSNLDKKIDKFFDWFQKHDLKDDDRHDEVNQRFDEQHKEMDDIKRMLSDITTTQAVEKIKLGVIVGAIILIGREIVGFVANKLF